MKLALGSVQFGLDYGVTNTSGKVSINECHEILRIAIDSGVSVLDTAADYGCSEQLLGQLEISQKFSMVTKVSSNSLLATGGAEKSIRTSLANLRRESIDVLLLHNELDLLSDNADRNYRQLINLKNSGLVNKIGVSVYSVTAAQKILSRYHIDLIQIPANHLDRRFEHSGVLKQAKKERVEIHARSLFLQGLLAVESSERPVAFQKIPELSVYDQQVKALKLTPLQLALSYITSTPLIDFAVIGCVSVIQLKQILDAYKECVQSSLEMPDISTENTALINPVNW